jgi:hypothetical protein
LDIGKIYNTAICSLRDEEWVGDVCPVGTLQLYNRKHHGVTQLDMRKIEGLRKLFGSTLIKCSHYSLTL